MSTNFNMERRVCHGLPFHLHLSTYLPVYLPTHTYLPTCDLLLGKGGVWRTGPHDHERIYTPFQRTCRTHLERRGRASWLDKEAD